MAGSLTHAGLLLLVLSLPSLFVHVAAFQLFSTPQRSQSPFPESRSVFPQLTWLRDTAIEKVFGVPSTRSKQPEKSSNGRSVQVPRNILAQYGGDLVLRFNLTTPAEEQALAEAADTLFLDVWEFTSNWADIRLRSDDVPSLLGLLPDSLHHAYANLIPDLAKTIYQSYPSIAYAETAYIPNRREPAFTPALRASNLLPADNVFFQDYQPMSVIMPWMRLMASMFSTHVRMVTIGTSYEGRDIPALTVGVSPKLAPTVKRRRNTVLIMGGSHAREWISVSTVTYLAWSLITSYGKSPTITEMLHKFDFVFVPSINVDGYVYTWENDRLWRKNRQQTTLRFCRGLDLDRTFGFEWDGMESESNPCSESFPGDEPFQAVETHRLAEWAKNETEHNKVRFVGFLDFHAYSQQVLYPYSYTCTTEPPSLENLEELGIGMTKAIRIASGEQYTIASACEGAVAQRLSASARTSRMESGGGSAIDWFYHDLAVRFSYQIKLRDTGSYGFLLPKENIVPTGEEAFSAVKYFGDFLLGNKGIEADTFAQEETIDDEDIVEEGQEEEALLQRLERENVDLGAHMANEAYDLQVEELDWELRRRRRRR